MLVLALFIVLVVFILVTLAIIVVKYHRLSIVDSLPPIRHTPRVIELPGPFCIDKEISLKKQRSTSTINNSTYIGLLSHYVKDNSTDYESMPYVEPKLKESSVYEYNQKHYQDLYDGYIDAAYQQPSYKDIVYVHSTNLNQHYTVSHSLNLDHAIKQI
ncbi:hypothetical protein HK103_005172 [Boothiomyces macroporosus]|uniref:Uncharacterized protein n=1 Tax=Boothiomyces macroporosus TaxID=261099 RepID=A0AAD5UFF2_9FUNG|nr:hypothetical protein HK103_005172 [Boothiomyces macroporosus]